YPPYPFDLSSLQSEAYRHFGYSPARTLASAERLYLDALISYPRTSSQKLPPDIGYAEILGGIGSYTVYQPLVAKLMTRGYLRPNNGPKDDPAHPAIFPTGESPKRPLSGGEAKLYDLILRRFMATFADFSLKTSSRMILTHDNHRFLLSGSRVIKMGWIEYYRPYVLDDARPLPDFRIGDRVKVQGIKTVEKFTQPLHRLRPIMLALAENEEEIGYQISEVIVTERVADVTFDTPCPKCGLKLAVVRSRGSGKRFIGCNGKWQTGCNFTLPLPQFGNL